MNIIGCDFGLVKSGIVVLGEEGILSQSLIRVKSKAGQRLVDIEAGFDQIIRPYRENIIVFVEGYAYGAKYQRESLAELGGVMRRYFCLNNLEYWVIPPTMLKSFVTNNGKASKNYMKKRTKEKWGLSFKSDDVCDAYGLARLGRTVLAELPTLEEHEYETVNEILTNKENYWQANTARRTKRK